MNSDQKSSELPRQSYADELVRRFPDRVASLRKSPYARSAVCRIDAPNCNFPNVAPAPEAVFIYYPEALGLLRWRYEQGRWFERTIQSGDVLLIPSGVATDWEGDCPDRCFEISIHRDEIANLLDAAELRIDPSFQAFAGTLLRDRDLTATLDLMSRNSAGSSPLADLTSHMLVQTAVLQLAKLAAPLRWERGRVPHFGPMQRRRLRDFVMSRRGEAVSLDDCAGELGLSKPQFLRSFKEATGESALQWLIRARRWHGDPPPRCGNPRSDQRRTRRRAPDRAGGKRFLLCASDTLTPLGLARLLPGVAFATVPTLPIPRDTARPQLIIFAIGGAFSVRQLNGLAQNWGEPEIPILVIADDPSAEMVRQAIAAGIRGMLPTTAPRSEWLEATRRLLGGRSFFPSSIHRFLDFGSQSSALTPRETEVLSALAEGRGQKMIAARLAISVHTVEAHLRNLYRKLGVRSAAAALVAARRNGLV